MQLTFTKILTEEATPAVSINKIFSLRPAHHVATCSNYRLLVFKTSFSFKFEKLFPPPQVMRSSSYRIVILLLQTVQTVKAVWD